MPMSPQAQKVLALMLGKRVVYDLIFSLQPDGSWLCEDTERHILIRPVGREFNAMVLCPEHGAVQHFNASFECCTYWAKGRCGILPDQRELLCKKSLDTSELH